MKNYFRFFLLFFFLSFSAAAFSQDNSILINEFLADNKSINQDEDGKYSDWIEIYNYGSETVSLEGFTLTDDRDEPEHWVFPDIRIDPGQYLLIFASGEDRNNPESQLHTNFSLSKSGEFVGLYDPSGAVLDSLSFGEQRMDVSFGRNPNDISAWIFFTVPTPGEANSNDGVLFSQRPHFSISGGFYESVQNLELSTSAPNAEIYYTIDGTIPDENAFLYTFPVQISQTTPVRAAAFENGKEPSDVVTHSFFINEDVNLPFISLVTDPDHFFSDETGIYVTGTNGTYGTCQRLPLRNLNQDWERPVNLEFYETDGNVALNQGAGVKIFGGCSRTRYPQKSLSLFARNIYGTGNFDYQLFPDKDINSFEAFILRSSADDQVHTMLKDAFAQYSQVGFMDIDYQAYRPVVVFINGEYWGIHNMREKLNEHYLADNYEANPDYVNILENQANVVEGSAASYNALVNFVTSKDLNDPDNYAHVKSEMDVDQYIDYQIANIYLAENDWPGNNIKFWKENKSDSKWRWLTFDRDQTYQLYRVEFKKLEEATDATSNQWPNPEWSTRLFRNLLDGAEFRNQFIQTYAYHLNTTFEPERLIDLLNEFQANIAPEIPNHIERWGGQLDPDNTESWVPPTFSSVEEWENNVEEIRFFANERMPYAISNLEQFFDLDGMAELNISSSLEEGGKIFLYNYEVFPEHASGEYFLGVPLILSAVPPLGYEFSHWAAHSSSKSVNYNSNTIHFTLEENTDLTAVYAERTISDGPEIIINEINYHSPDDMDAGDWLELYNRSNSIVDLSGWILKDSNDDNEFILPDGTLMEPGEFIVLVHDEDDFINVFPDVTNRIGSFSFNLSNGGELVRLYTSDLTLIDQVEYDDEAPWPTEPDGNGPTLELINYDLDNDLPSSWGVSHGNGTPGKQNSIFVTSNEEDVLPKEFTLYQNYPNPFNPSTVISYHLPVNSMVKLEVFDLLGQKVATLVNERMPAGNHEARFDARHLASGIYLYRITSNGQTLINKMTLIK